MTRIHKHIGKLWQIGNELIIFICPIKRLLKRTIFYTTVYIVFGIYPITYYKQLNELKQTKTCAVRMFLVAIDLVKRFF